MVDTRSQAVHAESRRKSSNAMKEWAMGFGATHYSHWFQPLTGAAAEKHDSFLDRKTVDSIAERRKLPNIKKSLKCDLVRTSVDRLEIIVDDALWPLPKYRELLFLI